jgi:hypothetical protein
MLLGFAAISQVSRAEPRRPCATVPAIALLDFAEKGACRRDYVGRYMTVDRVRRLRVRTDKQMVDEVQRVPREFMRRGILVGWVKERDLMCHVLGQANRVIETSL